MIVGCHQVKFNTYLLVVLVVVDLKRQNRFRLYNYFGWFYYMFIWAIMDPQKCHLGAILVKEEN